MGERIRFESTPLISSDHAQSPLLSHAGNSQSSTPVKSVRRKATFLRNSSDTIPSSHASIFEAEYLSSSDDATLRLESWNVLNISEIQNNIERDENTSFPPPLAEIGITPILYGHGTQLTTIVEQKSSTTMCSARSNPSVAIHLSRPSSTSSISCLSSVIIDPPTPTFLTARNSFDSSSVLLDSSRAKLPERKKSYSADDLATVKWPNSYETCSMVGSTIQKSFLVHEIYAKPKAPFLPPLERPSTPPGVPSWTDGQRRAPSAGPAQSDILCLAEGRRKRQRGSFRSFLRSEFSLSCGGVQTAQRMSQQSSSIRSSPTPGPGQRAPRFRPVSSSHGTGPLDSHPFARAADTSRKEESAIGPAMPPFPSAYSTSMAAQMSFADHAEVLRDAQSRESSTVRFATGAGLRSTFEPQVRTRGQVPTTRSGASDKRNETCPHSQRLKSAIKRPKGYTVNRQWRSLFGNGGRASSDPTPQQIIQSISLHSSTPAQVPETTPAFYSRHQEQLISTSISTDDPNSTCWKCRVHSVTKSIDNAWEKGARWCCWVCCGVQLDEDEGQEAHELLRPRMVAVDGVGVMMYR